KVEPIANCLTHLKEVCPRPEPFVIYTSPQGRTYNQLLVEELANKERLTIICGHYKGVDQRAIDKFVDLEISIGDYILSGGELPAAVIADSIIRLQEGVLGDPASAEGDSFSSRLLDCPWYTQPSEWDGMKVPEVLLSGHHAKIEEWRLEQAVERTKKLRPDIYTKWKSGKI
ncbi:tRNA (guanosine(37)-N1)-methyltransferase TrmD, partial [Calditrichota bacterium]